MLRPRWLPRIYTTVENYETVVYLPLPLTDQQQTPAVYTSTYELVSRCTTPCGDLWRLTRLNTCAHGGRTRKRAILQIGPITLAWSDRA